jgi:phosphatidylinositol alpha-mannosyltransferase
MRIALVSPYSWTYPGGVTRHIEALAEHYLATGHEVRVLAALDPPGTAATVLHRGARPQPMAAVPDYLIPLGGTAGFKANGAVSNLIVSPAGAAKLVRELRAGHFDVAHVHEPIAPLAGWASCWFAGLPLVGTFHSYSTKWLPNTIGKAFGATQMLNRLHVRIAVSEAAAWTGRRWFGGRYRVIPNGVHVDSAAAAEAADRPMGDALRLVFVGQAVERKGLPMLLRAFEALREHVPAELTVVGPTERELAPLLVDATGVRALGKVDDARKHEELLRADVLCAPSLGGESFGMVLTEAFAAGTPVIASDIPGYRSVVDDGVDGVLVPVGEPVALAEALRDMYHEPERRRRLARAAARAAERFAWERVATEVMTAYEEAIAVPRLDGFRRPAAVRLGLRPADLRPKVSARRLDSLEIAPERAPADKWAHIRRGGMLGVTVLGIVLGVLALRNIGVGNVTRTLIGSSPAFVLLGLATMCTAMAARGIGWFVILKAALPRARIHLSDAMQGTFIGVLMSSTLPARLGEPARALVVARRTGQPRENLPAVLGTIVSQTLLNILALAILGAIMFSAVDVWGGNEEALLAVAAVPAVLVALVLLAPIALRFAGSPDSRLHQTVEQVRRAMVKVRDGLAVFRQPRLGAVAAGAQLSAWAIQSLSCYLLLLALGLGPRTGIAAAAGVLFAVNVTAVLPATPANLGVFQAACAAVLHTGWHIPWGTAVAYGVILQAVEVTTAVLMGMPALLREGMSWREVRMRAMHAAPVRLSARPGDPRSTARSPVLSPGSQL